MSNGNGFTSYPIAGAGSCGAPLVSTYGTMNVGLQCPNDGIAGGSLAVRTQPVVPYLQADTPIATFEAQSTARVIVFGPCQRFFSAATGQDVIVDACADGSATGTNRAWESFCCNIDHGAVSFTAIVRTSGTGTASSLTGYQAFADICSNNRARTVKASAVSNPCGDTCDFGFGGARAGFNTVFGILQPANVALEIEICQCEAFVPGFAGCATNPVTFARIPSNDLCPPSNGFATNGQFDNSANAGLVNGRGF